MKFDRGGKALPYPGNTIICLVPPDSPSHAALTRLQLSLKTLAAAGSFAFLPPDSFHMTLLRGVDDKRRHAEDWPRDLPLDMPLAEVTREFSRRMGRLSLPAGFRMRPLRMFSKNGGGSQVALEAADEEERRKLRQVRDSLMRGLNHERLGDRNYAFHITLSYCVRPLSDSDASELAELHRRLFVELLSRVEVIEVGKPRLCDFDDLTAFRPVG